MIRTLVIAAAVTLLATPAFAQSSPAPKAMGSMHPAMKGGNMSHGMKSTSGSMSHSMKGDSMKGGSMKGGSMKGDHMKMKASPAPQ